MTYPRDQNTGIVMHIYQNLFGFGGSTGYWQYLTPLAVRITNSTTVFCICMNWKLKIHYTCMRLVSHFHLSVVAVHTQRTEVELAYIKYGQVKEPY